MKDIKGYEGIYKISEDGRVWSCYYKKFLSPFDNGHGYLYVVLNKDYNKVKARIHRLVAEAYVPNPKNLPFVVHKDGNKLNNSADNLEWAEKQLVLPNRTWSNAPIQVLCVETKIIYPTVQEAAESVHISRQCIYNVLKGKQKTAGGFHWAAI